MPLVFGYGSLVNRRLRGAYLNEWPARFTGPFRRAWNAWCITSDGIKYTALGLEQISNRETVRKPINGVVFEVTAERYLQLLDREKGYYVYDAPPTQFVWQPDIHPTTGSIAVFVPYKPQLPTVEYPIHPQYLQNCVEGFNDLGQAWLEDFYESILW